MDHNRLGRAGVVVAILLGVYLGASGQGLTGFSLGILQSGTFKGAVTRINCSTNITCTLAGGTATVVGANAGTIASVTTLLKGDGSGNAVGATATDVYALNYIAGGGTANAQTVTLTTPIGAYTDGLQVCWLPSNANTSPTVTLAVSGLAAQALTRNGTTALVVGDLSTTAVACALHVGTDWQLQNPQTNASANQAIRSVGAGFDGGGSALTVGKVAYITMPPACTIAAYNIAIDTGTISFDVWKIATGTAIPTVSNSILTGGFLAVASGTAIHSASTSLFTTTTSAANDIYGFEVQAVSGATQATINLQCNATT